MHTPKIISTFFVSMFCVGIVYGGFFTSKVPDSKIIEDAVSPFSITGTQGRKPQCTFSPYRGDFKVEILNRYDKKFDGEDWQCFELKVTFTSEPTNVGYGRAKQQSIRVFRFEYAYIQRGNRWERKGLGNIDYCLNEWKYAKMDPTKKIIQKEVSISGGYGQFSDVVDEIVKFCTKQGYNVTIFHDGSKFPRVPIEMSVPGQTNSASYPYEAAITLKVDTRDGKPYENNVHLTMRFSAPDEAWELSPKVVIEPR